MAILEAIVNALAEHRPHGLRIEQRRAIWYQTCLGPVSVRRRVHRDVKGQRRYLLDEFLGVGKRDHTTLTVKALALESVANMPYRRTADVLSKTGAIELTHQTVHRLVQRVATPYMERAERELKRFMETGELPEGKGRAVARLMVEADGVILSLQREKEKKVEVKLGIAYEGWQEVSRDRFRTMNKTVYAAVNRSGDDFWAGMTLKLQEKYDVAAIGEAIVGVDGALWDKNGAAYLGGRFQLTVIISSGH